MEEYDVIIIGAGPGGLQCAETLGNSHLRVLLIEKNDKIGPKVCAGGLTIKDISYLQLPESLIEFTYHKAKIHVNELSSTFIYKQDFIYTIDREELGQWQFKKLKTYKNIEVRTNTRVTKIDKNHIFIGDQKITYKFLVGADGSTSIVKKYLGIDSKKIGMAMQYIIPTNRYKKIEIFFNSKLFLSRYAWIFPHRGYVSIGCGGETQQISPQKLKENFKTRLDKKGIDISEGRYEAAIINYDYQGHAFDNIFLVGDAAGLASGLTGEGIYQAMVSGEEIAKKIINPQYVTTEIKALLSLKEKHNTLIHHLTKAGKLRTSLFFLGILLLKIPYFKRKAIALIG